MEVQQNRDIAISYLKRFNLGMLSDPLLKKMRFCPVLQDFMMQLIDVVSKAHQQHFNRHIRFSAGQKSPESIVLLYDAESALYLDRTVHAQQNSSLCSNIA